MVGQRRDRRAEYMKKWFDKAQHEEDTFDQFICGWLALVSAANIHWTISGKQVTKDTKDRELVKEYFKHHADSVTEAVQTNPMGARALAQRMGTGGGIIIDGIQEDCKKFRGKVLAHRDYSSVTEKEFAVATAEILNRVRNNLFHGAKVYDDTTDLQLLKLVTPLLLTILSMVERLGRHSQEQVFQA